MNEEKNIDEVLSKLNELGYKNILVIDGKSKDNTTKVAEKHGAKVVSQVDQGKGNAIRQVLKNNYFEVDAYILMDADCSMNPGEIPEFIKVLNLGVDVVKGSRFVKGGGTFDMDTLRRFGNSIMIAAVNLFWLSKYTDLCYGYMAFNKNAVEKLSPVLKSDGFEIETEIFIKALDLGLVVQEVPSIEYERRNGNSNLHTFRDGFRIFNTIFRELFRSL
jgi:glycosyltransferase involved in cell wall biosynthesis